MSQRLDDRCLSNVRFDHDLDYVGFSFGQCSQQARAVVVGTSAAATEEIVVVVIAIVEGHRYLWFKC